MNLNLTINILSAASAITKTIPFLLAKQLDFNVISISQFFVHTNRKATVSAIRIEGDNKLDAKEHSGDYICRVIYTDKTNDNSGESEDQAKIAVGDTSTSELIQKIYVYKPLQINTNKKSTTDYNTRLKERLDFFKQNF